MQKNEWNHLKVKVVQKSINWWIDFEKLTKSIDNYNSQNENNIEILIVKVHSSLFNSIVPLSLFDEK